MEGDLRGDSGIPLILSSGDSIELTPGGNNVSQSDAVEVLQLDAFGFSEHSFQLTERLDRADVFGRHTVQQM